jgi:transcriptional regulator with XRE-family HTH domain
MVPKLVRIRIGIRLRLARAARRVALQDVARACNVSRQAVSLWERGETMPTAQRLDRAAKYLGVSTHWLLTGDEPPATGGVRP